jgi:hypothetical protein
LTRRKPTGDATLTLDAATGQPVPTPPAISSKAINLHNLEAIKREMGKVYRDMRQGRIESQDGTRLVYVLGQMAKVHEIAVLEKRLAQLEKLANDN